MSKRLRYFPMYVDEFDDDPNVLRMDLETVGLYLLCLNESWKRGSIPADPEELAILIRRRASAVIPAWEKLKHCWIEKEPGRLVNQRQEKERLVAAGKIEQARTAAKTRWSDADAYAPASPSAYAPASPSAYAPAHASASKSISYSSSESKKKELRENQERWFSEELWPNCWRKVDRAEALKCFCKQANSLEMKDKIVAAAQRASEVYLKREPDKRPHMSTWLNKQRFEDEFPEDTRFGEEDYDIRKAMRQ